MSKKWFIAIGGLAIAGLIVVTGGIAVNSKGPVSTQTTEDRRFEKLAQYLLFDDLQASLSGSVAVMPKDSAMNVFGIKMAVGAPRLSADYEANEVAADQKYKGSPILISGTVSGIRKDIVDSPYVSLVGNGYLHDVQARFDKVAEGNLASVAKGQKVNFVCEVGEQIVSEVMLEHCMTVAEFTSKHRSAADEYVQQILSGKQEINKKTAELIADVYVVAQLLPQQSGCFTEDSTTCESEVEKATKAADKTQKEKLQADATKIIAKLNVK